jgi:hypothetical protein
VVPERAPVRHGEILDVGAAGVRRLHDAEEARARPAARGDERLDRITAKVGIDRQRIDWRCRRVLLFDVGVRVGSCRGADVAALAVCDDEEPGVPRVVADLLERAEPVRSESLEERELRFHPYDVRCHRIDESCAEARACFRRRLPAEVRLAAQLDGKQVRTRVEADEKLATSAVDRLGQPIGEQRDRRLHADPRLLRHVLSLLAHSPVLGSRLVNRRRLGRRARRVDSVRIGRRLRLLHPAVSLRVGRISPARDPRILGQVLVWRLRLPRLLGHHLLDTRRQAGRTGEP